MCIYIYIHIYHHFEWFNPDSISFLLIQSPRWSAKNPTCFPGELDILLLFYQLRVSGGRIQSAPLLHSTAAPSVASWCPAGLKRRIKRTPVD